MDSISESLLCVANFPANTGYAWDYIEGLYASLADSPANSGRKVYVAYPAMDSAPRPLHGSKAISVTLDLSFRSLASCYHAMKWVRAHRIRTVYFSDRLHWSLGYIWLRLGGVQRIVVHDHTSGERKPAHGLRLLCKQILGRLPWVNANQVIAVSDYVAQRYTDTGIVPADKVKRLWNWVADGFAPIPRPPLEGCLVVCSCRAIAYKGVHILFQAFDRAADRLRRRNVKPQLLYLGDGPDFDQLKRLWETLKHRDQITMLGYREDAKQLVASADFCVVPSIWQEACPLSVAEAMMCGKAVIASRVGGIPELIEDGVSGVLVPPEDVEQLAQAIESLVMEPAKVKIVGQQAKRHAATNFDRKLYVEQLEKLVLGADDAKKR